MHPEESDTELSDTQKFHKEQGKNRRKLNTQDKNKIVGELKKYQNLLLLDPSEELVHLFNGLVAPKDINVHDALCIGEKSLANVLNSLPDGFHNPLNQQVKTMQTMTKSVKIGNANNMEKGIC